MTGRAILPRERAIAEQSQASDPAVSAFVEASAGSGKTKLLTDRMLRLMLGGAHPSKIQCLTFTKAAAAEMALRLQHRLGEWVTLDDAALDAKLVELKAPPTEAVRATARALFAVVLDLPGGMRIGTIHAFCQGLLRRFPLEAAISPHFQLVEEAEAEAELRAAREDALAAADPAAVAVVAGLLRADDFAALVQILQGQRRRIAPLLALPEPAREALIRRAADCVATSEAAVLAGGVVWPEEADMRAALMLAQAHGSTGVRERAMAMLAWLSFTPDQRVVHWSDWADQFLDAGGGLRKFGNFPNPVLDKAHPAIRDAMVAEQERLWFIEDSRRAIRCVDATAALLRLAGPALDAYEDQKEQRGLLDYSDLIGRTERLLEDPGAAWVLYKLDGGVDHLLLDEVQDTAPEQWRIAHRLTEEFFAGLGAAGGGEAGGDEGGGRTFFAVGDPKQSIYSFQGADPAEFVRSQGEMARRVGASGQVWRSVRLEVSFRSTAPVLALVDAVFGDPVAAEGVAEAGALRHFADRAGAAGRVELWPLAPAPEKQSPPPWTVPAENQASVSAPERLADGVAGAVRAMLDRGERLESRGRALEAGDVLVLVRRRGAFATALVRALKAKGVPVAGLDRMALNEQIAVQDLLAACDAVLLPEDDLAVACVLTSPLGGLSDDSLMLLAMGRRGSLIEALRDRAAEREDWRAAWVFLSRLAERADYGSPHALLTEALGVLGGRARLLARLGAEAAEPIDELLNAALSYTRTHPPSLQGFVQWVRRSGAEVKREAGGAGSVVRVMTAHGAKGLQAPLVILPDTTGLPPDRETLAWCDAEGVVVPLWAPRKELRCAAVVRSMTAAKALRMREYNRLLYVALTRAEDRLVVCGWQMGKQPSAESWYAMVQRGFDALDAEHEPFAGPWHGEMMRVLESEQAEAPKLWAGKEASPPAALPGWAGRPGRWTPSPAPEEPLLPSPLAPSRPAGAAFGPAPAALSPMVAGAGPRFARGTAVHALLQHLPALPEAEREAAALDYLARAGVDAAERDGLAAQVLAVLAHPALTPLFGPLGRAEQPLSGLVGGQVVLGVVDRMAVLPDRVLLADFKTGRAAPETVEATPARYLRQLAAYRAVLRGLFPGRPVQCALVWTDGAVVSSLPDGLLDLHAPGLAVA
jgi:ATP-dependent helicase/nuclease subunit A